jgi:hypothetical protein
LTRLKPMGSDVVHRSLALMCSGEIDRCSGPQEKKEFSSNSPAWSLWIAPGRIGFMNTQRRDDRSRVASCKDRLGSSGSEAPTYRVESLPANAPGQTAPLGAPALAATNSLRMDRANQQPIRLVCFAFRPGSPPPRQAATQRPSFDRPLGSPPFPISAGYARFHSALPRVRSAFRCPTERYDGKRNLYFQHAA